MVFRYDIRKPPKTPVASTIEYGLARYAGRYGRDANLMVLNDEADDLIYEGIEVSKSPMVPKGQVYIGRVVDGKDASGAIDLTTP